MRIKRRHLPLLDLLVAAAMGLVAAAAALAGLWIGSRLRMIVR